MHGREMHTKFWEESLKERDQLEDLGIDGGNIKMVLKEIGWESVDLIHLAEDRDQWWAFVNTRCREFLGKLSNRFSRRTTVYLIR
jgi:hypothetical protein